MLIPTMSCQLRDLPSVFLKAINMIVATSMTHENKFHIKLQNLALLLLLEFVVAKRWPTFP